MPETPSPIVVVGDSYAVGVGATSDGFAYPAVLGQLLEAPVQTIAAGRCGFVARGPKLGPFYPRGTHQRRARHVPNRRRLLVLQGSGNDRVIEDFAALESAMHRFLDTVGSHSQVLVTGAIWAGNRRHLLPYVSRTAQRVAEKRGLVYADTTNWFGSSPSPAWLAIDGGHPSDTGHRVIAERLADAIRLNFPDIVPAR